MNLKRLLHKTALLSTLALCGCAASQKEAMLETIESPQTGQVTLEALQEDLSIAEQNQVHLISPRGYSRARDAFKAAEILESQSAAKEKIFEKLQTARRELESATAIAQQNRQTLTPLLRARQDCLETRRRGPAQSELAPLEARYLDVIDQLERPRSRKKAVRRISELTQSYKDLAISNLQVKFLTEAKNNIFQAKSEGASEVTPNALREAEAALKTANDVILQDQSASALPGIEAQAIAATSASKALLQRLMEAKSLKNLSPEEAAVKMNTRAPAADDHYARVQRVRSLFSEDEARVYEENDRVVISLKKIRFPSNQSDIPNSSLSTLRKIDEAIRAFTAPSVTVEGHTDSTGSADLNMALSEKRAEAVKLFLVSNQAIKEENIQAIGYGAEKPTASNKSQSGRAMNRRIDIVIKE